MERDPRGRVPPDHFFFETTTAHRNMIFSTCFLVLWRLARSESDTYGEGGGRHCALRRIPRREAAGRSAIPITLPWQPWRASDIRPGGQPPRSGSKSREHSASRWKAGVRGKLGGQVECRSGFIASVRQKGALPARRQPAAAARHGTGARDVVSG